jgi:hypothetical protein
MMNARRQAEGYARCLPMDHGWPPFILVCDVGHCLEVYADFSGQGRNYAQFPGRQGFRIYLEDLREPATRERLRRIWTDPRSLDPARETARVTREIAGRLAAVSRALEKEQHAPENVALFLMRCLFTMFAQSVGLLPPGSFRKLLLDCEDNPARFVPMVRQLWEAMNVGGFAHALKETVRQFNGEFFKEATALPLDREEIGELRQAASYDWRDVEPAIFGTLLEQALNPAERRRLGAHYTPRAFVERLVAATVIEPLRDDWAKVLSTAERQKSEGRHAEAAATVRAFHDSLCRTRVLDPACGTGNFLYVALELMKRLEGEVLEALTDLGGQEALQGLEGYTVDPHQFLGLELNPRAAAIAELVLWIGYLQWHYRTQVAEPSEPILRAFRNIVQADAVLKADRVPARGEAGTLRVRDADDGREPIVVHYRNPRRPDWPAAEFIVGNPPFIGGKDLRARLGDEYTEALWAAHPRMNQSADFVMYWWDHAAELLAIKGTVLRRFGLVTTNSISQVFQRRVVARHFQARQPISLVMAIPDHPWTKATKQAAAVRIAMTVGEAGTQEGRLREVVGEGRLDTDQPEIGLTERIGMINADLSVGVDVTAVVPLRANEGLCSPGVKLHGAGFIVTPQEAEHLGFGRRPGLERHIRQYRNGRDLTGDPRGMMVIDLFGLEAEEVLTHFPEVYQHLLATVKEERRKQHERSPSLDAAQYLEKWWVHGKPRGELRSALSGLSRYIGTVETMCRRAFLFKDESMMPDNKIIVIGLDNLFHFGVLSSRVHLVWILRAGGWLGAGNDSVYVKTRCFDTFPLPDATDLLRAKVCAVAEEMDAHRQHRQSEHPDVTPTEMYSVLAVLRTGSSSDALDRDQREIYEKGLVLILKELHDRLDAAVLRAYGWPEGISDEEILARLVALNKERAAEEAAGHVRWLRPDYQVPRFASPAQKARQIEAELVAATVKAGKPRLPSDEVGQTAAVLTALANTSGAVDAKALAAGFRQSRGVEEKVRAVLMALARLGYVASSDGGRSFALRRAA